MAINYQYSIENQDGYEFHVIRTKISVLRPQIINSPQAQNHNPTLPSILLPTPVPT